MSGLDFNTNTTNSAEWLTPPSIVEKLGPFDLDPCTPVNRPWNTAREHYSSEGLYRPWKGRVWLNPPYGSHTFKMGGYPLLRNRMIICISAVLSLANFCFGYWVARNAWKNKFDQVEIENSICKSRLETAKRDCKFYKVQIDIAQSAYDNSVKEIFKLQNSRDFYISQCKRIITAYNLYNPDKPRFIGQVKVRREE